MRLAVQLGEDVLQHDGAQHLLADPVFVFAVVDSLLLQPGEERRVGAGLVLLPLDLLGDVDVDALLELAGIIPQSAGVIGEHLGPHPLIEHTQQGRARSCGSSSFCSGGRRSMMRLTARS
jgi:hypothetical protein